MNAFSLFKVQSLVAIVLCTSLNAWGASPNRSTSTAGTAANRDELIEDCIRDMTRGTAEQRKARCEGSVGDSTTNITEVNSRDRLCKDSTERANNFQTTANSALEAGFAAYEAKLDQQVDISKNTIAAQQATTDANTKYQAEIAAINLSLPSQVAQANSAAAKNLLALRGEMVKLGAATAAAETELDAAKQAIADFEIAVMTGCTDFAAGKANAKIDAADKARNDLLGRTNTFVNYGTTTVAGSQKRRNAKRARDAQNAYMAAYSACMSGQADLNGGAGGGGGPGPTLRAAVTGAQNRLPTAEKNYQTKLAEIEAQRQLVLQQMAQLESDKNEEVKRIAADAQIKFNAAQATLTTAINAAQASVATAHVTSDIKGPLWDSKMKTANGQWTTASAQAQDANMRSAAACGDVGQNRVTNTPQLTVPSGLLRRSGSGR